MDSGGLKEPYVRWSPDPHAGRGNFEGESGPAQNMSGHVRWSIYSKRLSRGQNGYGADADLCIKWGAHLHNLVNTIEPSVFGGDLITCYCLVIVYLLLLPHALKCGRLFLAPSVCGLFVYEISAEPLK